MAFPYHTQETNYTCGAASMRMVLEYVGIKKTEKQLAKLLQTNKMRGTWPRFFPVLAEKYKLDYLVKRNSSVKEIRHLIKRGYLIIVIYYYKPSKTDHYSVVKKIDDRHIYFWDPSPDFGPTDRYSIRYFEKIWKTDPHFNGKERRWLFGMKHTE